MPELTTDFQSLPEEYQKIIRLAQDTHKITIAPLELLVGGWSGAVVYLVGVVATTVFFHVPRNEALARLDPARDSAGFFRWLRGWVRGNHIRSASAIVAGALLLLAEPAG